MTTTKLRARDEYKVDIPEGRSGDWSIKRFEVDEQAASLDAVMSLGHGGRFTPAGRYTRLSHGTTLVMSDTPDEIRDHWPIIRHATGNVLIAGLGLGMVLQAVARKPEVLSVVVIEQSNDVIALVEPHYRKKRWWNKVTLVQADIFEWKPLPVVRFNAAWFDVWDNLCTDNLDEMAKLHRRFTRRCDWYGSWGYHLLQDRRRRERARGW